MKVLLNGASRELPAGVTVAQALAGLDLPPRGVAVAIDAEVVPRSEWDSTTVVDGARIEVVQAVQGG